MVVSIPNDRAHLYDLTTGLPLAQPGSVLWSELYTGSTDMRLSPDERLQAAQDSAAAESAVWMATVEETVTTGVPPAGYVVMTFPNDQLASLSTGRHLAPKYQGFWLLREKDAELASSFGFRVVELPTNSPPTQE